MNIKTTILVGLAIGAMVGLIAIPTQKRSEVRLPGKVVGIKRVMMHTRIHYTIFYKDGDELKQKTLQSEGNNFIKIATDVPKNEDMWAEWIRFSRSWDKTYYHLENVIIHVHDVKDINGAGWDRGKHGSGTTTVLE